MLKHILHYLFPATCVLCKAVIAGNRDLCAGCNDDLPWLSNYCPQCGYLFSAQQADVTLKCGWCLRYKPPFDSTFALWQYKKPLVALITGLKFNAQLKYARLLGDMMADALQCKIAQGYALPQCIIPVPLHRERLQQRGFNQALELARPIQKRLDIALDVVSCSRIKATLSQSSLTANKRAGNVKGAFGVSESLAMRHVAIIDDVMTTGHTVSELSKQLRRQGVRKIDVWCCARTVQS